MLGGNSSHQISCKILIDFENLCRPAWTGSWSLMSSFGFDSTRHISLQLDAASAGDAFGTAIGSRAFAEGLRKADPSAFSNLTRSLQADRRRGTSTDCQKLAAMLSPRFAAQLRDLVSASAGGDLDVFAQVCNHVCCNVCGCLQLPQPLTA